jgi:signal peptidase II
MRSASAWGRAGVTVALVLVVDQLTKIAVRSGVAPGERDGILPGVELVHVENRGVAFGFLEGGHAAVIAAVAAALIGAAVLFALHARRPLIWLPAGLLVGGAVGNLIDRVAHGSVTDFVKLPLWPAFNVADVAITLGVLTLLYLIEGRREDPPPKEPGAA